MYNSYIYAIMKRTQYKAFDAGRDEVMEHAINREHTSICFICICLVFVTVFSLAGCGKKKEESSSPVKLGEYKGLAYLHKAGTDTEASKRRNLVEQAVENAEFGDISSLIRKRYNTVYKTYEQAAEKNNMSVEEYVKSFHNMTLEEFKKSLEESVTAIVKEQLVLKAIAEKEGLTVDKDSSEYENYLKKYMAEKGYSSKEEFLKDYSEEDILDSITCEKAIDFIEENASS